MKIHSLVIMLFILFQTTLAFTYNLPSSLHPKLTSHNPNYFSYVIPTGNNVLTDDPHLEFLLSIQYPIHTFNASSEIFFSYDGLYDFYIVSDSIYESAPVFSRRQNPGISYRFQHAKKGEIQLGYYHESNGQTLDASDGKDAFDELVSKTSREYALTQVSRGWDYLSFTFKSAELALNETQNMKQRISLNFRKYLPKQAFRTDREDDLFWRENPNLTTIKNYDGLRFSYELLSMRETLLNFSAGLELKPGIADADSLKNLTGRITLTKQIEGIPFSLFYFDGYGKELSTYHLRTQYAGIGLEFR